MTLSLKLTWSQLMALRTLVSEHLLCPGHVEVYVDVVDDVETTPAELFALLMQDPRTAPSPGDIVTTAAPLLRAAPALLTACKLLLDASAYAERFPTLSAEEQYAIEAIRAAVAHATAWP